MCLHLGKEGQAKKAPLSDFLIINSLSHFGHFLFSLSILESITFVGQSKLMQVSFGLDLTLINNILGCLHSSHNFPGTGRINPLEGNLNVASHPSSYLSQEIKNPNLPFFIRKAPFLHFIHYPT